VPVCADLLARGAQASTADRPHLSAPACALHADRSRTRQADADRWPTSYGECIRTLGLREGLCDHKLQGHQRGAGVDRGPGEAVRASGGPAETRGDTRRRPSAHGPAETRGASGTRRADSRGVQGWGLPRARRGTGSWPGRRTATRRRRPAWHTGHWPMSTPVKRNMRVATGSGPAGAVVMGCFPSGIAQAASRARDAAQPRRSRAGSGGPPRANGARASLEATAIFALCLFPHERRAAPPSKAAPLRVLRAAPRRSPAQDDVDCNVPHSRPPFNVGGEPRRVSRRSVPPPC